MDPATVAAFSSLGLTRRVLTAASSRGGPDPERQRQLLVRQALGLYRAAGFTEVDPVRTAEWNQGQPASYVWFEWPGFAGQERSAE